MSSIKGKKSSILEARSSGRRGSAMQSLSSDSSTPAPSSSAAAAIAAAATASKGPPPPRFLDKEPGDGEFDVAFDEVSGHCE